MVAGSEGDALPQRERQAIAEKLAIVADENVVVGRLWLEGIQLVIEKRHPLDIKDRLSIWIAPGALDGYV